MDNSSVSAKPAVARPVVAISSCLLGEAVRYDGGTKSDPQLAGYFQKHCKVMSVCPEIEMGLGVPREPIEVVIVEQGLQLRSVSAPHTDLTSLARDTARKVLENTGLLAGWIFKARSPSCGLDDTPFFNLNGEQLASGAGIFAAGICSARPWLPVVTESGLQTATQRRQFLLRTVVMQQLNDCQRTEQPFTRLRELDKNLRDRAGSLPDVVTVKLDKIVHNHSESEYQRFCQYRQVLMACLNQN